MVNRKCLLVNCDGLLERERGGYRCPECGQFYPLPSKAYHGST